LWPKNPSPHPSKKAVLDISNAFSSACVPVMRKNAVLIVLNASGKNKRNRMYLFLFYVYSK